MVKRCQWGLCNSDSRYPDRLQGGIEFIPFPKPKRSLEKCKRWIRACGRPHDQLNVEKIDGNKHMFVCTKHFLKGKPTEIFPDPVPADATANKVCTPARKPPKRRPLSEPPVSRKKRRVLHEMFTNVIDENQQSMVGCSKEFETMVTQADASLQEEQGISPLDMLALAAENSSLKAQLEATKARLEKQLGEQILQNEDLRRENSAMKNLKPERHIPKANQVFSVESVRDSPIKDNFKYYTGFVYVRFMCIFKFLVPSPFECPINFPRTMSSVANMKLEDQLLLTLVKLRLNSQFKHLAYLFGISVQDAGLLFRQWINYMFFRFGSVPIWPEREIIQQKMPSKFREDFPNTLIILDGTELKLERPSSLRSQSMCYSDYKSATTLKGLVGIDPRGSFTFISMLFSGSISDKEITKQSGLLETLKQLMDSGHIKKGDGVMVDKGFLIREEIEKLGLKLYIPPFASGVSQMPAGDVALTKKIAKHRVHVERAISRAKKFKIVDNRIDLSLFPSISQIWFCCCFLTGFMPLLINDKVQQT